MDKKTITKEEIRKKKMDNFNDANLESVEKHISEYSQSSSKEIYTMVQLNSPCRVVVTDTSRKKFTKTLFA